MLYRIKILWFLFLRWITKGRYPKIPTQTFWPNRKERRNWKFRKGQFASKNAKQKRKRKNARKIRLKKRRAQRDARRKSRAAHWKK